MCSQHNLYGESLTVSYIVMHTHPLVFYIHTSGRLFIG